ncbi:hypothetical protein CL689_04825 [Candidatus Saccharibacteria bacterium]|nr:hypothetical protein [Candidatus Saccharibacteria bacterium]|tara:strand:- start:3339 stop:3926 length:588 start_codon:yes stop_codon:yes gene_type:complete
MNPNGFMGGLDPTTLNQLAIVMQYFFYAAGVLTCGHGIWKLVEASQAGKQEGSLGLRSVMIGGALMSMGPIIGFVSNSFGMQLTNSEFNEVINFSMIEPVPVGNGSVDLKYLAIINTFINLVILFGYWSVGKGILMMKKTSDGAAPQMDEGVLSGLTHIGFGALLVNVRIVLPSFLVNVMGFDPDIVRGIMGAVI